MAAPPEAKCQCVDHLSFIISHNPWFTDKNIIFYLKISIATQVVHEKNIVLFGAFFDLIPEEHKAFCDWLDIFLK